eukprot:8789033-Pyramimonas_sp.AAC.2
MGEEEEVQEEDVEGGQGEGGRVGGGSIGGMALGCASDDGRRRKPQYPRGHARRPHPPSTLQTASARRTAP